MSRINDWMIEMEDAFWEVYTPGASDKKIIREVQKRCKIVDENYIRCLIKEAKYE